MFLLVLWYGVAIYVRSTRQAPFPLPGEIAVELFNLLSTRQKLLDHSLYAHIFASLQRWFWGYAGGVGLGLGTGLLATLWQIFGNVLMPLISFIHLIPGLAWIPIAILVVGINSKTSILLIVLTTMPPVSLSLNQGLAAVPKEFLMISRMCGDRPGRRFFAVQLPASLPHLLTGLRLALANSWRVVVAAEMVIGSGLGLGYSIIQSRWTLDYAAAFTCIGAIVAFGLLVDYGLFGLLEKITVQRWGMTK